MAGTAGAFLDECRSHLGFEEGPDNETPFGVARNAPNKPWCAAFVSFCLNKTGTGHGKIVWVPNIVARYREEGRLFTAPQPGDVFCLWFPSKNRYAHTGAVESVDGSFIWTVEGNSNAAGERTGGKVVRLHRKWKGTRTVFARPPFAAGGVPLGFKDDEEEHVAVTVQRPQGGYMVVQADGGVFCFDGAPFRGSLPGLGIVVDTIHGFPIVGGAWAPSGDGYWLVAQDGALFAFGAPAILGANVPPLKQHLGPRRVVGLVATSDKSVKIIAQETPGDFDFFDASA
jgi:CHAP domain